MFSKRNLIIGGALLFVVLIVAAFFAIPAKNSNNSGPGQKNAPGDIAPGINETQSKEAAKETQSLIDEAKKIAEEVKTNLAKDVRSDLIVDLSTNSTDASSSVKIEGVRVAPGSSIVNTATGDVVNDSGEKVNNSAPIGTPQAPGQSQYVASKESLPPSSVALDIGANFIKPNQFTVKAGQAVSLTVSSVSELGALLKFEDPSLSGVAVSLMPNRTKGIVFNAPTQPGEYVYYSDYGNQKANGAVGKMIVQ